LSIFNNESNENVETTTTQTNTTEAVNNPSPASTQESFSDLLSVVLNDEGEQKYSSVPEAMKGLVHSQEYIRKLKGEMASLQSELDKRTSVEEALNKQLNPPEPEVNTTPAGLSVEDVTALLEQREQKKAVESNTKKVAATIQEKFGDKAEEVFYGKAKELGMTNEQFNNLAAQSPNAVLAYFNTAAPTSSAVNQSSINTSSFQPKQDEVPTIRFNGEERIKLEAPTSSVLAGATHRDLLAEANRHKEATFKKYGVTL
jgi:hypothetical protein